MSKRKNLEQIMNDLKQTTTNINNQPSEESTLFVIDEDCEEENPHDYGSDDHHNDNDDNQSSPIKSKRFKCEHNFQQKNFVSSTLLNAFQSIPEGWMKQQQKQSAVDTNNNLMTKTNETTLNIPSLLTNSPSLMDPGTSGNGGSDVGSEDGRSIYRGLYPINDVKQYFRKNIVDNKKLYTCLWEGCNFKTWKYSQHISRHIYLKHIGIKKLECKKPGCGKMFKRPESLVQHTKNHSCGFGIDSETMKDPNNVCGARNIKRYFTRILDNDIDVYQCKYGGCGFHTHNSGSIRRHVHNQHVCPFSSPSSASNNHYHHQPNHQQKQYQNQNTILKNKILTSTINQNQSESSPSSSSYYLSCESERLEEANVVGDVGVEVEFEEFDEMYDPVRNHLSNNQGEHVDSNMYYDNDDDNHSINGQNKMLEHLQKSSSEMNESIMLPNSDDDDDLNNNAQAISEENRKNSSPSNGLYSLKNFKGKYYKVKTKDTGEQFVCVKCNFHANSQVTLVRHLWNESDYKDFSCESCDKKFDNEFFRYKHRKNEHQISSPPEVTTSQLNIASNTSGPESQKSLDSSNNISVSDTANILPPPQQAQLMMAYHNYLINYLSNRQQQQQQQSMIHNQIQKLTIEQLRQMITIFQQQHQDPTSRALMINQNEIDSQQQIPHEQLFLQNQKTVTQQQQEEEQRNIILAFLQQQKNSSDSLDFSFYNKITNKTDSYVQFQCKFCPDYLVRTKSSMMKHLRSYHGLYQQQGQRLSSSTSTPSSHIETNDINDPHGHCNRTSSENFDETPSSQFPKNSDQNKSISSFKEETSESLSNCKYKGRDKTGLYSLKKFPSYYRRKKMTDGTNGYQYECTYCKGEKEYATKSQASMIRHIWQHIPQDFKCQICQLQCENEFALYKHKKTIHPEMTSQHNRTKSSSNNGNGSSSNNRSVKSSSKKQPILALSLNNENQNTLAFQGGNAIRNEISTALLRLEPNHQWVLNGSKALTNHFHFSTMDQILQQQLLTQENPISLVKEEEQRQQLDVDSVPEIDVEIKSTSPMKTSRRNLQFKKYKYPHSSSNSSDYSMSSMNNESSDDDDELEVNKDDEVRPLTKDRNEFEE